PARRLAGALRHVRGVADRGDAAQPPRAYQEMIEVAGLEAWAGLAGGPRDQASVVVAGVPYDGSAVYRRGAAQAPSTIRRLSAIMPPVDERGGSLAGLRVWDLGDLDLGVSV